MSDILQQMSELTSKLFDMTSTNGWMFVLFTTVLFGMFAYFHSQTYRDWVVSRAARRAGHKEKIDKFETVITKSIDDSVKQNFLTAEEANELYVLVRKACPQFKELGTEPSFGRPWYYGPTKANLKETKARVLVRLQKLGLRMHEIRAKQRGLPTTTIPTVATAPQTTTASDDQALLVASIKRSKISK